MLGTVNLRGEITLDSKYRSLCAAPPGDPGSAFASARALIVRLREEDRALCQEFIEQSRTIREQVGKMEKRLPRGGSK
jgi:hypothetical protein